MRSLRAWMQQMLLLLLLLFGRCDVIRALDNAAGINNNNGGGGGGSSIGGSSSIVGAVGTALSGPPGALNANLTDLGSPGSWNELQFKRRLIDLLAIEAFINPHSWKQLRQILWDHT
ncbi:hypothetical protein AWZ03_008727 [Drosophila navojoa]|uniref:Uncharacterized protein n=1 Tax=Drosophila navojoa TaxID=7232 RepID=A0A484B9W7_DRONA|nr:hypothetical protein AWZ03_008727 [Drosophila navojoa]